MSNVEEYLGKICRIIVTGYYGRADLGSELKGKLIAYDDKFIKLELHLKNIIKIVTISYRHFVLIEEVTV